VLEEKINIQAQQHNAASEHFSEEIQGLQLSIHAAHEAHAALMQQLQVIEQTSLQIAEHSGEVQQRGAAGIAEVQRLLEDGHASCMSIVEAMAADRQVYVEKASSEDAKQKETIHALEAERKARGELAEAVEALALTFRAEQQLWENTSGLERCARLELAQDIDNIKTKLDEVQHTAKVSELQNQMDAANHVLVELRDSSHKVSLECHQTRERYESLSSKLEAVCTTYSESISRLEKALSGTMMLEEQQQSRDVPSVCKVAPSKDVDQKEAANEGLAVSRDIPSSASATAEMQADKSRCHSWSAGHEQHTHVEQIIKDHHLHGTSNHWHNVLGLLNNSRKNRESMHEPGEGSVAAVEREEHTVIEIIVTMEERLSILESVVEAASLPYSEHVLNAGVNSNLFAGEDSTSQIGLPHRLAMFESALEHLKTDVETLRTIQADPCAPEEPIEKLINDLTNNADAISNLVADLKAGPLHEHAESIVQDLRLDAANLPCLARSPHNRNYVSSARSAPAAGTLGLAKVNPLHSVSGRMENCVLYSLEGRLESLPKTLEFRDAATSRDGQLSNGSRGSNTSELSSIAVQHSQLPIGFGNLQ